MKKIRPTAHDATRKKYRVDWDGKKATVRTKWRVNLIEAQQQILERSRQYKAARGAIIAVLVSLIVWAVIVRIMF